MTARFHTTTPANGTVTVTAAGEVDLVTAGIRVLFEVAASHTVEVVVQRSGVPSVALEVSGLVDVVTIWHPSTDPAEQGGARP